MVFSNERHYGFANYKAAKSVALIAACAVALLVLAHTPKIMKRR